MPFLSDERFITLKIGSIVWDSRKEHYNIQVAGFRTKFGRRYAIGTDGRKIPAKYAVTQQPRKEDPQ